MTRVPVWLGSPVVKGMAGKGHEDQFPRPRLNGRYPFGKETFA
jgi:hypothetical protein